MLDRLRLTWFPGPVILSLLMTAAVDASEEIPVSGEEVPALASFDRLMRTFVEENELPGATLAVARHGRLVYARGFGWADRDAETPMHPDSRMRIASISKPITAVTILRLIEQRRLSLDDRIVDLLDLSEYTDPRWKQITVLHCLQHSGGWDRDVSFDAMFRSVQFAEEQGSPPPADPREVIQSMLTRRLDFDPGTQYAYSNFGYCLLGRVIERVTKLDYDVCVRRSVLQPLRIRGMQIGRTLLDGRARNEVRYYTRDDATGRSVFAANLNDQVPKPYGAWHLEAMDAHGGWIASAIDLVRFGSSLSLERKPSLLTADSIETMFAAPQPPLWRDDDGKLEDAFYGLGWMVRPIGKRGRNTWHTGSLSGTSTILVRRWDDLCWAVLFNSRETADGKTPSREIDSLVHKAADAVGEWPEFDRFGRWGLNR